MSFPPPPGDLPNPGIKPVAPALAGGFFTTEAMSPEPFLWAKANMKQRLSRPISLAVPGLGGAWWGPSLRASPVCDEDWGGVEIGVKLVIRGGLPSTDASTTCSRSRCHGGVGLTSSRGGRRGSFRFLHRKVSDSSSPGRGGKRVG